MSRFAHYYYIYTQKDWYVTYFTYSEIKLIWSSSIYSIYLGQKNNVNNKPGQGWKSYNHCHWCPLARKVDRKSICL